MSTRHGQDADPAELAGVLAAWMPQQRWFAAKGDGAPVVPRPVGRAVLGEGMTVELVEVASADGSATLYQVPLSLRAVEDPALEAALVGRIGGGDPAGSDGLWVYDGLRDPALVRAWLRLLADGGTATGADGTVVHGVRQPGGAPLDPDAPAKVLAGEQSNTSVVVDAGGPAPAIVKLFRVLAPGENPDVVVQSALAAAGCERVPRPVGRLEGTWWATDGGAPVHGHLAFASEFLAGSEDAWRVACRAVDAGAGFEEEARALGGATAEVHTTLAEVLPTRPATPELLTGLADGLRARVDWAVAQAPDLAPYAAAARAAVDGVRQARSGLVLQQVHGDYHLGQVLHSPGRGWVLLDFEGEPLRPLAERLAPDLALRDVAGMLRSFDYAARHATVALPADDPRVAAATAWAQGCRTAFLDGYGTVTGHDPREDAALLLALELDKSLYEVVYETRNRPAWVAVPMHAVNRLLPLHLG
ncbi:aminoglycoside phosphotransferase [Kineosporia sp. A_224]|uniref:maltokinase N-terminal cap-like domain-containing protein n=1 Tax=Kineosporia sp. A_224 TaxID=1962180 RepID=UPI000B4AB45E|nr:aminoglycoside phosphotransferase [Kineosporia sp. A_224]